MKTYARIDNGVVAEVIQPLADEEGNEVPVEKRFTPEFVATLVDITGMTPLPEDHWAFDGGEFSPPSL